MWTARKTEIRINKQGYSYSYGYIYTVSDELSVSGEHRCVCDE